jgi:type VI secretion system protein ImpA
MPSPDVLDFAKLLTPIPGDKPSGIDLRVNAGPTSPYYQVKDGRNAARAAERRMEGGQEDAPTPDWKSVTAVAIKILSETSKDLEITAYLIEGLCRTHTFAGLPDGFRLAREMVETFWEALYPSPDEEGVSTTLAPLTGLNGDDSEGTLIAPINRIAITESSSLGRLTYSNYLQAVATDKILDPKAKEKKIAAGAMNFELIQKAVAETPALFYRKSVDDLTATLDELDKLSKSLDAKAGQAAPPTSAIRTALQNVLSALNDIGKAKLAVTQTTKADDGKGKGDDQGDGQGGKGDGKPGQGEEAGEKLPSIRTRDDALNALLQLSEYFRRTEPQSLVPYALDQAVRWARMPFADLMAELIPDEAPRKALFKQVGVRAPEPPPKEEKKK